MAWKQQDHFKDHSQGILKNPKIYCQNSITIRWGQRQTTHPYLPSLHSLFVKNLQTFADELTLRSVFSELGRIVSCKVVRDDKGLSKGYGFVDFDNKTSLDEAIETCNGRPLFGRSLVVQGKGCKKSMVSLLFCSGYHHNWCDQSLPDNPRTEFYVENLSDEYNADHKLRTLFETFGELTYAKVVADSTDWSKVFGYVSYKSSSVANTAIRVLNGMPVRGGQRLSIRRVLTVEEV
jgi:polyadenylate-binding protein